MQAAPALTRENLSDTIACVIRNMIIEGALPDGSRINEVHLAARLGVSRTPLREALAGLTQEGALSNVPRVGYFVRPLSLDEFEQIYPIRSFLDPEALRLAGLPSASKLARLRRLNAQLAAELDADAVIALDDEWHLELIGDCPNKVLLELIGQFIRRTRRYEIALMRERRNVRTATGHHVEIMAALEERDIAAACAALRSNLEHGFEPIADWLRERPAAGRR